MTKCINYVSIGYIREDGDFAILSTHNNIDEYLTQESFLNLVQNVKNALISQMCPDGLFEPEEIIAAERQDADDYINFDPDEPAEYPIDIFSS
mgnify:CR=1 FL=1